jgi:GTP-dependent phosphoenolpyruvate carboxykinase
MSASPQHMNIFNIFPEQAEIFFFMIKYVGNVALSTNCFQNKIWSAKAYAVHVSLLFFKPSDKKVVRD